MASEPGAPAGTAPGMVTAPTGSSLQRLAEAAWERIGDGSRLVFEGREWTGSELALRARRLSDGLRAAGLEPGDRVVVMMANCPEVGVTYRRRLAGRRRRHPGAVPAQRGRAAARAHRLRRGAGGHHAGVPAQGAWRPRRGSDAARDRRRRRGRRHRRGRGAGAGRPVLDLAELEAGPEGDLVDADPASAPARCSTPAAPPAARRASSLSHDALSASAWAAVDDDGDRRDRGRTRCAAAAAALPRLRAHGHRGRDAHAEPAGGRC